MLNEDTKTARYETELKAVKTDVSIIIVNWNTRDALRDCLNSIYEQGGQSSFEIIVIDNASIDGSAQMVKTEFSDVILIQNRDNKGYAGAANQGIAVSKGRYVLIVNSDIIIYDGAIDKVVKYADTRNDAAIVTCQVLQDSQTVQMTCFRFPSLINLFLSASGLAKAFRYNRFFGRESMLWWKATVSASWIRHLECSCLSGARPLKKSECLMTLFSFTMKRQTGANVSSMRAGK